MQELPKGDALRPKALISCRALLEKTASRISTVQEIPPAKLAIPLGSRILFLSLNPHILPRVLTRSIMSTLTRHKIPFEQRQLLALLF